MKPLKPTKEQKRAIVKALGEFKHSVFDEARYSSRDTRAKHDDALYELLGLLGIPLKDWEEM